MEEVASLVVDWIVKQRNRDPFISASCRAQPTRSPHMTGYAIEADQRDGNHDASTDGWKGMWRRRETWTEVSSQI